MMTIAKAQAKINKMQEKASIKADNKVAQARRQAEHDKARAMIRDAKSKLGGRTLGAEVKDMITVARTLGLHL